MNRWHRLRARLWRRAALECAGMTGRCLLAENDALMAAARGRRTDPTDARRLHPAGGDS